jgi:5-methylcytosine-specific restriction endonuclease McrA
MRREFPTSVKRAARDRANGRCEECTAPLRDGGYHFDHVVPDGLGGEPTLENCSCCCKACHDIKTRTQDVPRIAKMKRQRDRAAGIKARKGRPLDGCKDSGWKKPFNGPPERRT